jgi:hypothetical protein
LFVDLDYAGSGWRAHRSETRYSLRRRDKLYWQAPSYLQDGACFANTAYNSVNGEHCFRGDKSKHNSSVKVHSLEREDAIL